MTNKKKIPDYWEKACIELSSKDHSIGQIINKHRQPILSSKGDVFFTLIRSIVGQQISVYAADAVWDRIEKCVQKITPNQFLKQSREDLRKCGLSFRKIEYILGIAETWKKDYGSLEWDLLSDEEVKRKLTALRGVGPWTAEMILMFSLLRPDIFPVDDIGAIRAMEKIYNNGKEMDKNALLKKAEDWIPWRSVATWYLWRTIDDEPVEY